MFLANGANKPKHRFCGFTDAWKHAPLGNIANFSEWNWYNKKDLSDIGIPIILYSRLYTKYETLVNNVDATVDMKNNSVIPTGGEDVVPA
ncbi:MAG: hypothetical protein LBE09_02165 [Christensenellaceae bacterium]|jgi:type I restriction enzyme S subunit|nr:hypothetical protein [Christensenellaceae bacterium]